MSPEDAKAVGVDVRQELEAIRAKNPEGLLLPADVVAEATMPDHPLHSRFNWDDTEAAHQYRLWQARELIQMVVHITTPKRVGPVRYYVSLASDRIAGGYRALPDVLNDKTRRQEMLDAALLEYERLGRKYDTLKALRPVRKAVRAIRQSQQAVAGA